MQLAVSRTECRW